LPENSSNYKARYWEPFEGDKIKCKLCPRECIIPKGNRGFCFVRENIDGELILTTYGRSSGFCIDPIEKKPLYHFLPGSEVFSVGFVGCNLRCPFCQNYHISQDTKASVRRYTPEDLIQQAQDSDCPSIAYTYSEPVIFYEYLYDTAVAARNANIGNVIVSNGFIQKEPLIRLCQQLTAVKIDLKGFTEKFYQEICRGRLKPVLDTLATLRDLGIWYEIVVLLVPTLNDSQQEIQAMTRWIAKELGADVPVHFSRFQPMYKLVNLPPTPVKTLEMARNTALDAGLCFVYIGNVPGHAGENTYCPNCHQIAVQRAGYRILNVAIDETGHCQNCQTRIAGLWSAKLLES
jgi:pyruvate formate lyase activating enzyme